MSLFNRLRSMVPGFNGIRAGLATAGGRNRPSTDEKVPSSWSAGLGGRIWFLPYADNTSTGDSPEIRAAMRLMLRDPWIKAAWLSQVLTVLSQDFQVHHPDARHDPRAQDAVDFVRHCIESADGELVGLGTAILMNLGSDGFSLCEKVWGVEERHPKYKGRYKLRALKPKDINLHVQVQGDQFRNVTGVRVMRTNEVLPISDFAYIRYLHTFDEPFGMAAFRAGYGAYWMRDTVRKLRVIRIEKADGLLVGEYEDEADKGPLEAMLARAKVSTWASIPAGVKVNAIDKSKAAEPDFKSFDESLREETISSISFASLHILQGNIPNARGDTKVHKAVSDLGPWLLTYLVQLVLNRQVIPDLIDYNFAGLTVYPRVTLGGVTNQEIKEQLEVLAMAQARGFNPSRHHYATASTIQEADPQDPTDQLVPPAPPPMPPGMPGATPPGQPPDDPLGNPSPFVEPKPSPPAPPVKFAEWKPYKNPKDGRSGWVSPGGLIRYSEPKGARPAGGPAPVSHFPGVKPFAWLKFSDPLPTDEVALAGKDGKRAAELLRAAKDSGRSVLSRLAEQAVARMLADRDPLTVPVLFADGELKELADSLSATTAAADLLGRARVHRMADHARTAKRFAENDPSPFAVFDDLTDPIPAVPPAEAIEYFRRLVPSLDLDPLRYGPRLDRHAFTLAAATDEALLGKVKGIIQKKLETGVGSIADVQAVLDEAGVAPRNPQYAEMAYRTSMMDAYNQGQTAELARPEMQDTFPVWQYLGIADGRQGDDHAPRFCDGGPGAWTAKAKYFPTSAAFADVRGPRCFNCRCSQAPVSKWEWAELQAGGAAAESGW